VITRSGLSLLLAHNGHSKDQIVFVKMMTVCKGMLASAKQILANDRGIYEGVFQEGSGSNESFSFVNAGVRRSVRRALTKMAVKKLSRLGRPAKCRNK